MLYRPKRHAKSDLEKLVFDTFVETIGFGNAIDIVSTLYLRYAVESFEYSDDYKYAQIINYFRGAVIPHKKHVWSAGLDLVKLDCFSSWRIDAELFTDNLYLHDLSKFSAIESFAYALYFSEPKTPQSQKDFDLAWLHHKHNNPHHPEYWFNVDRSGTVVVEAMPRIYVFEMVADWIGAGKTYGTTIQEWLPMNFHHFFNVHPQTIADLHVILGELGITTIIAADCITAI